MSIGIAYRSTLSNIPLYTPKKQEHEVLPSKNIKITDDEIRVIRTKHQKESWSLDQIMEVYGSNISRDYMYKLLNYEARSKIDVW